MVWQALRSCVMIDLGRGGSRTPRGLHVVEGNTHVRCGDTCSVTAVCLPARSSPFTSCVSYYYFLLLSSSKYVSLLPRFPQLVHYPQRCNGPPHSICFSFLSGSKNRGSAAATMYPRVEAATSTFLAFFFF